MKTFETIKQEILRRSRFGIELMQEYYDIAVKRVRDAQAQIKMDLA